MWGSPFRVGGRLEYLEIDDAVNLFVKFGLVGLRDAVSMGGGSLWLPLTFSVGVILTLCVRMLYQRSDFVSMTSHSSFIYAQYYDIRVLADNYNVEI